MLLRYWKKSCECNIVILETSFTDQDRVSISFPFSSSLSPRIFRIIDRRKLIILVGVREARTTRFEGGKKKERESGRANKVVVNPDLGGRERDSSRGESSLDKRVLAERRRAAIFVSPGWTRWWIIRELPDLSLSLFPSSSISPLPPPLGFARDTDAKTESRNELVAACRAAACTRYLVVSGPCSSRKKNV